VCPTHSIYAGDPHFLIDHDTCADCFTCIEVCPVDAIRNPKVKVEKKK
jgi:NAD-dependent dihydropyrimidine dehydrogenase PreA subunit